jgi:hypothetical protein
MAYPSAGSRILRTSLILLLVTPLGVLLPSSARGQEDEEHSQSVAQLPSQAAQRLEHDRSAIYLTHVPHLNATVHRGGQGSIEGGPAPAISLAAPSFSGNSYNVGKTVTPTTTIPEGEEEIAVFPSSSSHLVAAISDFSQNGGFNTTKYVVSTSNGAAWNENFVPSDPTFGFLETSDGFFWLANSDPVVAIDKSGYVYIGDLYLDAFDNGNGFYVNIIPPGSNAVTVANTRPIKTNPDASTIQFEDKPWITVDTSNTLTAGRVYASWSHFTDINAGTDYIAFSRSTNHGATWSAPLRISLHSQDGAVQGSAVAVGPNGAVYVVYEVFYTGNNRRHFLAKSTNGGSSFSAPVPITPVFTDLTFSSTYRKSSFAALSVNPVTGYIYAIYCDQPGANARVEFVRSTTPGATTFTAPVVLNDNASGQRLMPAIAVDKAGIVHMSWFDTRNSPANAAVLDIYATFSKDNGGTFSPNARVTAFSFDAGSASFIGDYSGIAAAGGQAHPVWTNGGFNNGHLQTATLTVQ